MAHVLSNTQVNGQESLEDRQRAARPGCESRLILHPEGERGIWGLQVPLPKGLGSWMRLRVEGSELMK